MSDNNEKTTDWQKVRITGGDGDANAKGVIDLQKGIEGNPCFMCKSWEKDEKKLAQHFQTHGLTIEQNGAIQTPIVKDFPGRPSITLYLQNMGWCRREARPTEDAATCEAFRQVATREDMRFRMALRDRVKKG